MRKSLSFHFRPSIQTFLSQENKASIKTWEGSTRKPEKESLTILPEALFGACRKMQETKHIWPLMWDPHEEEDGNVYGNCSLWGSSSCCVTAAFWVWNQLPDAVSWGHYLSAESSVRKMSWIECGGEPGQAGSCCASLCLPITRSKGITFWEWWLLLYFHLPNLTQAPLLAALSQNHVEKGILI